MPVVKKNNKVEGIEIDGFLIAFPENDSELIKEDKDGNMFINVDIYKLDPKTGEKVHAEQSEVTPELESKINAFINEILLNAIEASEKGYKPNE